MTIKRNTWTQAAGALAPDGGPAREEHEDETPPAQAGAGARKREGMT